MQHRLLGALRTAVRRRSSEVRSLAAMLLVSSFCALGAAAVPMTPTAPTVLLTHLGLIGLAVTALVWTVRWHGWRHLGPLAVLAGVTAVVVTSSTPGGTASSAVGCVWVAIHAALSFRRRLTRAYVVAVAVTLAGALAANPYPGWRHTWFFVVLTATAAAEALTSTVSRLHRLAGTDPLTGLLNRQGLETAARRVLEDASRSGSDAAVVLVDLDGFKAVNDRDGHAAGDALLVALAAAWRGELRPADLLARYGGDEFVLVLPRTDAASAREVVQRLASCSPAAWSYGLAQHRPTATLSTLLKEADVDLYAAKSRRAATSGRADAGRRVLEAPAGA